MAVTVSKFRVKTFKTAHDMEKFVQTVGNAVAIIYFAYHTNNGEHVLGYETT